MILANILLIAIFIITFITWFRDFYRANFKGYAETIGYLVDHKESYGSDSTTYAPIIEYEVDGKKYRYVDKVYYSFRSTIGKKYKIMYNPSNPVESVKKHNFSILIFPIIALALLIIINTAHQNVR